MVGDEKTASPMSFVIVIGVADGPMTIACDSIEALLGRMREKLLETEDVVQDVGIWAIHARPGDWLDWDHGWVFAVAAEQPTYVRNASTKARH